MASFDWSKYRTEIDEGASLWKSTSQLKKDAERKQIENDTYNLIQGYRTAENNAYQAKQKAVKQKKYDTQVAKEIKKSTGFYTDYTKKAAQSERFTGTKYNPAKAFAESSFSKDYKSKLKDATKQRIENSYNKISNSKVESKIIKYNTVQEKMTSMDKFGNQFLGVFGDIKNLKTPKTVYQYRGGEVQDAVTKQLTRPIHEDILQIQVIAEDKDFYFYKIPGSKGGTSVQRVAKDEVYTSLPDLEEHKLKYMEDVVNRDSGKRVAGTFDKFMYNTAQGAGRFLMGSETKGQVDTGSEVLNTISNIGGELAGFVATPTGTVQNVGGMLGNVGEKVVAGLAKRSPTNATKAGKFISKQLTSGVGKAVTQGAAEMGLYGAMEKQPEKATPKDKVKTILEDMIVGGAFMGTFYGGQKGLTKIVSKWKGIPSTPETENLLKSARAEYEDTLEGIATIGDGNYTEQANLAADKFYQNVDKISKRYKTSDEVFASKQVEDFVPSKENVVSKTEESTNLLGEKESLLGEIDRLKSEIKNPANAENTALADQLKLAENKLNDLDLQLLGTNNKYVPEGANPNLAKTGEHISLEPTVDKGKQSLFNRLYTKVVDRNRSFELLGKKTGTGKNLATSNVYKMSNIAGSYEGVAKSAIEQGVYNRTGTKIGTGLKEIIKGVKKESVNDFRDYIVLKQAEFLGRTKAGDLAQVYPKEWNLTPDQMKVKLKEMENLNPEFRKISKKFTKYNRDIARTQLVESGLLSGKDFRAMELSNPFYIPNKRVFAEIERAKPKASGGFVSQNQQVMAREGSERPVVDPFLSSIENTFNYAKAAKRNEVGQTLYKEIEKNPKAFEDLIEIVQKVDDPKYDVGRAFDEGDFTGFIDNINQGFDVPGVKDISKPNIVRIRLHGENRFMRVKDPFLLDNLTNMHTDQISSMVNMVRKGTDVMKTVTTGVNPVFGLARNIWRDVITGFVQSKTTSNIPIVNYVGYMKDLVGAMGGMLKKSEGYKSYRADGGGFFSSAIGTDKNLLKETVAKYTGTTGFKKTALSIPKKAILTPLEWLNNTLETMPRYAEYNRTLKKLRKAGVDEYTAKMEGIYNGQDVTVNFKRSGEITKDLDAFVPYLNAAVQGLDKTLRTLDPRDPKQLASVVSKGITGITIPAMILYAKNKDNPAYQQLSNYVKDNNFLIPYGRKGEFIKIPKPREFGVLFGSLPERLLEQHSKENPKAFKDFKETVLQNFLPPNVLLEGMNAPIIRNVMSEEGRDWRGNPVVPQNLLKQSPARQYDENTSAIAKFLGEKMDFAPKKIDNIIGSYAGVISQIGKPATSSRTLNEKGVISAVFETLKKQVTADSKYSTDIADSFYTYAEKVNMKKADMSADGKLGEEETYIDSATFVFNNAVKQIADLRTEQKQAKSNAEKDKIQEKMNNIMDKVNKDYESNYTNKKKMNSVTRKKKFTRPSK